MSELNFACPACGQSIVAQVHDAGKPSTCPHCQAALTIPPAPAGAPPGAPRPQRTSGLAIASLVCSLFLCVGSIPGIICGHMAKRRIWRDASLKGLGLANAGLFISYLTLLLNGVLFTYWGIRVVSGTRRAVRDFQQVVVQQASTNWVAQPQTPTQEPTQTNEPAQTKEPAASTPPPAPASAVQEQAVATATGWTLNLDQVEFPERPLTGTFRGTSFVAESFRYRSGSLIISDSNGRGYAIRLGLKRGDPLSGTSYTVVPSDHAPKCRVSLNWSEDGNAISERIARGYALKLEFGRASHNRLPGKLYLCLPGAEKNYVAGTFTVHAR